MEALPESSLRVYFNGDVSPFTVTEAVAKATGSLVFASTRRSLMEYIDWANADVPIERDTRSKRILQKFFIYRSVFIYSNAHTSYQTEALAAFIDVLLYH